MINFGYDLSIPFVSILFSFMVLRLMDFDLIVMY